MYNPDDTGIISAEVNAKPWFVTIRYRQSCFVGSKNAFVIKESFSPLARESVPEALDYFVSDMKDGCQIVRDFQLRNGEKYKMSVRVTSRDFETGYADEWDWCILPNDKN